MRVLITFAVKAEFAPWSGRHPFVPYEFENWERRREFDLFKANIGDNEVTVLLTGMGRENAVRAVSSIPIDHHDVCISTGLAGSLDPAIEPGQIVAAQVAETLRQDSNVTSDGVLLQLAESCGAVTAHASLTSEAIVATASGKEALGKKGSIVEMESAHVLAAARQSRVPAVVVRAISDAADEDLAVDFARILDSHGHLRFGGLLRELGLHPYRIAPLIQFGRQSRAAANALADFLDRYVLVISQRYRQLAPPRFREVSTA